MKLLTPKSLLWLSIGVLYGLSSCSVESPWSSNDEKDGKIHLQIIADGELSTGTRADNQVSLVPNQSEFSISLNSTDGSYSNSWSSLDGFNKEEGFPLGNYLIGVSFGSMESEGFTNPYFYGESNVHVSLGQESEVTVNASLKNSMISIRYKDEFTKMFAGYSATVVTDCQNEIVFTQNETRPAYISTGSTTINLNISNKSGQSVTVRPTTFISNPKTHHIVTFGVEGNIDQQNAVLTVDWEEEVVEEKHTITLSDELFASPAPSITPKGYKLEGETVFQGIEYEDLNPEFHVIAMGGLSEATLHISTSGGTLPPCGDIVKLINADTNTQAQLKASGIEASGFSGGDLKMCVINFKEFVKTLSPGTYTVKLDVLDNHGRPNVEETPVVFTVKVDNIQFEIISYKKPDFLSNNINVTVGSNCDLIKDQLKFKAWNANSDLIDVVSTSGSTENGITNEKNYPYVYSYTVTTEDNINDCKWQVQPYLGSITLNPTLLEVNMPVLKIETDAYAKKIKFRVTSVNEKWTTQQIIDNIKVFWNTAWLTSGVSIKDNIMELTTDGQGNPVKPSSAYNNFSISVGKSLYDGYKLNVGPLNTETDRDDINFDNKDNYTKTLSFNDIQVGGKYDVGAFTYTVQSNIERYEDKYYDNQTSKWASLNDLTCCAQSSNYNTWYLVPSAFVENGEYLIRSVGYSNAGPDIPTTGSFWSTTYYGKGYPADTDLQKISGELFLGNFSYQNGNPQRTDGISFESRPSKLKFDYNYTSYNNESGKVYIKVLSSDREVIAENELLLSNNASYQEKGINLEYKQFGKKAAYLIIDFKSTGNTDTPSVRSTSEINLNEGSGLPTRPYITHLSTNSFHTFTYGSELKIKNVHLEY